MNIMASNASMETAPSEENVASCDASSPVVSVNKLGRASSKDEHKDTPVIKEPTPSEKSTPVSPMDNSFFPGPEKWWYQKEWEQQRARKKGFLLDLEPDNWWGCRRHSETDIIGLPPSVDRRHSLTSELSCTKPVAIKEELEETLSTCDGSYKGDDADDKPKDEDAADGKRPSEKVERQDSTENKDSTVDNTSKPTVQEEMKSEYENDKHHSDASDSKSESAAKEPQAVEFGKEDLAQGSLGESQAQSSGPCTEFAPVDEIDDKQTVCTDRSPEFYENPEPVISPLSETLNQLKEEESRSKTIVELQKEEPLPPTPSTPSTPSIIIDPGETNEIDDQRVYMYETNVSEDLGDNTENVSPLTEAVASIDLQDIQPEMKAPGELMNENEGHGDEQVEDDVYPNQNESKDLPKDSQEKGCELVSPDKISAEVASREAAGESGEGGELQEQTTEETSGQDIDSPLVEHSTTRSSTDGSDLPNLLKQSSDMENNLMAADIDTDIEAASKEDDTKKTPLFQQDPGDSLKQSSELNLVESSAFSEETVVQEERLCVENSPITCSSDSYEQDTPSSGFKSDELSPDDLCKDNDAENSLSEYDNQNQEDQNNVSQDNQAVNQDLGEKLSDGVNPSETQAEESNNQAVPQSSCIRTDEQSPDELQKVREGQVPTVLEPDCQMHEDQNIKMKHNQTDTRKPATDTDTPGELVHETEQKRGEDKEGFEVSNDAAGVNSSTYNEQSVHDGITPVSEAISKESDTLLKQGDASVDSNGTHRPDLGPEEPDSHVSESSQVQTDKDLGHEKPEASLLEPKQSSKGSKALLEEKVPPSSQQVKHRRKIDLEKTPTPDIEKPVEITLAPEAEQWKRLSFKIFIVLSVFSLLVGYVVVSNLLTNVIEFVNKSSVATPPAPKPSRDSIFHKHLKHLEEAFPSQSPVLWNVIGGAAYSHIQDPPSLERPVVLLLAGLPNSESTTRCLATQLGTMFYEIFQSTKEPVHVDGLDYKNVAADDAKMKIDGSLKSGLQSGSHCGIIHNLDSIPPCAIILFHSYCENDNAPYKDAAIIHTIQLDQGDDLEELQRPKDYERVVSKYLRKVWEPCPDLTEDKQSAMLSRVANNVAVVKVEADSQMRKVCG